MRTASVQPKKIYKLHSHRNNDNRKKKYLQKKIKSDLNEQ